MSNIHVLDQAEDSKTINVVYHYAVPAQNNAGGIPYQQALVQFLGGGSAIASFKGVATPTELTQMQAGQLYEMVTEYRWSKLGLNAAQKVAELQADYQAQSGPLWAKIQNLLQYYGYTTT